MLKLKINKVSLFMMNFDEKISKENFSELDDLLNDIDLTAKKIISSTNEYNKKTENIVNENEKQKITLEIFPPKINKYCKNCDFLNHCKLKEKIINNSSLQNMTGKN